MLRHPLPFAYVNLLCVPRSPFIPPSQSHPHPRPSPSSASTRVVLQKDPLLLLLLFSQGQSNGVEWRRCSPFLPPFLLSFLLPIHSKFAVVVSVVTSNCLLREIYATGERRRHFVPLLTRQCALLYLPSPPPPKACYARERTAQHPPTTSSSSIYVTSITECPSSRGRDTLESLSCD